MEEQVELEVADNEIFLEKENECHKVLTQLVGETMFVDPESDHENVPDADEELAFNLVSDRNNIESLFNHEAPHSCAARKEEEGSQSMPKTLLEAFAVKTDTFNSLFRLSVRLRCQSGGIDTKWIANSTKLRSKGSKLNWHQCLGTKLCGKCWTVFG